jgi:pimeloyl-ACP methyl ester carboxylesterase
MGRTLLFALQRSTPWRRWLRLAFILWALIAMSWLANSMRTRGVDQAMLNSSASITVLDDASALAFLPVSSGGKAALIFICGSGVAAEAYAPLLRPIAEAGHAVFVIKLPYRFAPLESHKLAALARVRDVIAGHPQPSWVIAGHSLGGALTARMLLSDAKALSAAVLIGTTHPKEDDLSQVPMPLTKVYASNDGIAPRERVLANRALLPRHTRWVEIIGGNHSQFGRYGQQLFDGEASISREQQELLTRTAILEMMAALARP